MKTRIRSAGAREVAAAFFALAFAGCTSNPPPVRGDLFDTPVVEHAIYVKLPPARVTDLAENNMYRKDYGDTGRRAIGHMQPRCVTILAPGEKCQETVDVRITAVEGAKYIDPLRGPKSPQLIAWVENLGDKATYDGFLPSANFVYALVVARGASANMPPVMYKVGFSMDRGRSQILRDPYGKFQACHYYTQPLFSEADFRACDGHRLYVNNGNEQSVSALVTALSTWSLPPSPGDPTWFSCSSGCCTSSYNQF